MPTLSEIRTHIQSVNQTRKITNAMYLVSTSRMRKALHNIEQNRMYFTRAMDTMRDIRARTNLRHPYLRHRDPQKNDKTAYIVIAGEKGLSGSYNHDVLALADESIAARHMTHIFTVGDMAAAHFRRMGFSVNEKFSHIAQSPSVNTARRLTMLIMQLYDEHEIDELRIVYTHFVNSLVHTPRDVQVLPIELKNLAPEESELRVNVTESILYEPSPQELFHELVPQFIIGFIYGALVNAYASENYARMTAMESATKSADEMMEKLTRQYHTARQVAITNELSEIIGASGALR